MSQLTRWTTVAPGHRGHYFEDTIHHCGEGLTVDVRRRIDLNPTVRIEWQPLRGYHGVPLKLFRSTRGFSAQDRPTDLSGHGEMVSVSSTLGQVEQQLAEGTYFYTFQFHRRAIFGLIECLSAPLRIMVEVPSLDTALKRLADRRKLLEMRHREGLRHLTRQTERAQAVLELEAALEHLLTCVPGSLGKSAGLPTANPFKNDDESV